MWAELINSLINTLNLSYRQIYARDSDCPERGILAGPGKYQRDTQYYHQLKPTEPRILFPSFLRSAERTLRDEGGVGKN